jgi:hypothetical protein
MPAGKFKHCITNYITLHPCDPFLGTKIIPQPAWQASQARVPEGKQEMGMSNIFQKLLNYQILTISSNTTRLYLIL